MHYLEWIGVSSHPSRESLNAGLNRKDALDHFRFLVHQHGQDQCLWHTMSYGSGEKWLPCDGNTFLYQPDCSSFRSYMCWCCHSFNMHPSSSRCLVDQFPSVTVPDCHRLSSGWKQERIKAYSYSSRGWEAAMDVWQALFPLKLLMKHLPYSCLFLMTNKSPWCSLICGCNAPNPASAFSSRPPNPRSVRYRLNYSPLQICVLKC